MVIARLYFGITSLLTDYFLSGSVASFMYRLAKSISTSSSASSAFKQNVVQAKCYMNKKDTPEQYLCSRNVIYIGVIPGDGTEIETVKIKVSASLAIYQLDLPLHETQ